MLPLGLLYHDSSSDWIYLFLRIMVPLGMSLTGGYAYRQNRLRSGIMGDRSLTRDLTPEQRLRLELGLIDTSPVYNDDPMNPQLLTDMSEVSAAIRKAREDSRQREQAQPSVPHLSHGELNALRSELDRILRAKWDKLSESLAELGRDGSGASWAGRLDAPDGPPALLLDLESEVRRAKSQPSYPTVALQLEGPVPTLTQVLKHARQASNPATPYEEAQALRESVVHFIETMLPGIEANIKASADETRVAV